MAEKKFVFIEGSPVHYPDFGDFAVCGKFWLNASTTPSYVTCEECKKIMVDSGIHIPQEDEEMIILRDDKKEIETHCEKCSQRLEECKCECQFPGFDPFDVYGDPNNER